MTALTLFLSLSLSLSFAGGEYLTELHHITMKNILPSCSSLLLLSGLLSGALASADRQQVPLSGPIANTREHIDEDGYTLFRHVDFPEKQMRYKRNDGWCDGNDVRSWR